MFVRGAALTEVVRAEEYANANESLGAERVEGDAAAKGSDVGVAGHAALCIMAIAR